MDWESEERRHKLQSEVQKTTLVVGSLTHAYIMIMIMPSSSCHHHVLSIRARRPWDRQAWGGVRKAADDVLCRGKVEIHHGLSCLYTTLYLGQGRGPDGAV